MSKLKWYDWGGVGEIPAGVKMIDVQGWGIISDAKLLNDVNTWTKFDKGDDIIAYTLGEPLEGGE